MGALTGGLVAAAGAAGAELRTGVEVTAIEAGMTGPPVRVSTSDGEELPASHVLANVAPLVLARLLGAEPSGAAAPEGSQLKLNMVLDPAAAAARPGGRGRGRVRRNLPRERELLAARRRVCAGRSRHDPGPGARRGVLPLADRPVDPRTRVARPAARRR